LSTSSIIALEYSRGKFSPQLWDH